MPRLRVTQTLMQGSPASRIAVVCGGLSALLGLVVMAGWHTQSLFLIQIHHTYAPMQYNTALGFLLAGTGLLLLIEGKRTWVPVPAILIGVIAGLTLLQYLFSFNFGIDEVFIRHYVAVGTSHPGRMAPNTALCFLLTAGAIHVPVLLAAGKRTDILDALLGSVVTALGLVAFVGYATGLEAAYGWSQGTPMAVHTALGFVFLGCGVVAVDWAHDKRAPGWVPVPVGIGVVTATLFLWLSLVQNENANAMEAINVKTVEARRQIEQHVKTRLQALVRMRTRWEVRNGIPQEEWESDALLNLRDFPGYQAIEWVDRSLQIRWIMPMEGNEAALNVDLTPERRELGALERAMTRRAPAVSRTRTLPQGGKGFTFYLPLYPQGEFDGYILGVFHPEQLLEALLLHVAAGYKVVVYDGDEEIYQNPTTGTEVIGRWQQETTIGFFDANWRLTLTPSPELLASLRTSMPEVALAVGLALTALLSLTVYFVEERRTQDVRRNLERAEGTLDRLLGNVNDAVYSVDAEAKEYRYVSPAFERLIGYGLGDIRMMGGRVAFLKRVVQEAAFDAQDEAMDRMRAGEEVKQDRIESWIQCRDGALRCFEDHWIPVYENGKLVSTDGVMRDVTERKQSQLVIRERDDALMDTHEQIGRMQQLINQLSERLGESPPYPAGS